MIQFNRETCRDVDAALQREWFACAQEEVHTSKVKPALQSSTTCCFRLVSINLSLRADTRSPSL
jgi:hypothetical protein